MRFGVGTARRAAGMYGPILQALPGVELVAVWGRSAESARRLGAQLQVPAYTDLDRLIRETAPQIGVVCVAYGANGQVGLMAVEHGLHALLETPIAHDLAEVVDIVSPAQGASQGTEVYHGAILPKKCVLLTRSSTARPNNLTLLIDGVGEGSLSDIFGS